MKLVLVRHGESEWNRLNLFTGRRDVELSEKGRQDATECSRLLREDGFEFDEQFQVRKKYDLGNQDDIQKRADLAGSTSRSHG